MNPQRDLPMTWTIVDWHNCYREGWGELLTARSYSHPAKLRFGLAAKIYQHILEEGWAQAGSRVVDCFGGIGGTAFHAMFYGMHWTGVELESRFHVLAGGMDCPGSDGALCPDCAEKPAELNQGELFAVGPHRFRGDLDVWKDRGLPGTGRIIQGDSRQLSKILADAQIAIASPPFGDQNDHERPLDSTRMERGRHKIALPYGSTPGNLGNLPATEAGFDIALSSPPYGGNEKSDYNLSEDGKTRRRDLKRDNQQGHGCFRGSETYGQSEGQLGMMPATEQDFWAAAKQTVAETYKVLLPGAHAVWIVKRYIKDSKIVDFPDQWRQLCERVGFETLHEHRAWVVEKTGEQMTIDGDMKSVEIHRKSFFRLLQERKGSPEINWETVYCMIKPL